MPDAMSGKESGSYSPGLVPFACPFCGVHWDDSEGRPYFEAAPAKDVPLVGWSWSCRSCGRAGFITVGKPKEVLPDAQV